MALVFDVKVVPSAGRKEWKMNKAGILKCYLKSPAEQGKANAELIKDIAKTIGISSHSVTIIVGSQSRKKTIKIDVDLTFDQLLQLLGIERQLNMFNK